MRREARGEPAEENTCRCPPRLAVDLNKRKRLLAAPRIIASFALLLGGRHPTVKFDGGASRIVVDLRTPLGLRLYRYPGYWDTDFDILDELREGDIFIDCGANIGLFSLVAARRVGSSGKVIAFEPAPSTRDSLLRNIEASGHGNVTVLPQALSDSNGKAEFVVMGLDGGLSSFAPADPLHGQILRVPGTTLDASIADELRGRIRMVKVDVEGAEVKVLRGALRLLTEERPILLIEVEDPHLRRQGSSAAELFTLLGDLRYEGRRTPGPTPNYIFRPSRASD